MAVGVPNATVVVVQVPGSVPTVISAGQAMIGFWLSCTSTICVQVAVFPLASVAVQMTVLMPFGMAAGALLLMLLTEQLSVAVAVPKGRLEAVQIPGSVSATKPAGQAMTGLMMS